MRRKFHQVIKKSKKRLLILGKFGYAMSEYLADGEQYHITYAAVTETCSLYCTTSPDDGDILTTLEPGATVELIQSDSDWSKVRFESIVGYMRTSLLKIKYKRNSRTLRWNIGSNIP